MRTTLEEMGHLQPATPLHCDNSTAVGIVNNTVKIQRSRSMEMWCFWVCDQCRNGHFHVVWCPGQEILADYQSKHHPARHHRNVRPWYLQAKNSPRVLPRAATPRAMRGCAETPTGGYAGRAPLPVIKDMANGSQYASERAQTRAIQRA